MARLAAAWASFRRLPGWVQVWVVLILVPVNLAPLAFLGWPGVGLVAVLSVGGMLPNAVLIWVERGFSRAMALSHVLIWTPLVALLAWRLWGGVEDPALAWLYLAVLLVDALSLGFDWVDAWRWWRGDRAVA